MADTIIRNIVIDKSPEILTLGMRSISELNPEHVQDLKSSKSLIGEMYPMIKGKFPDGHVEIISGRHRKAAGWKKEVTISVDSELDYFTKVLQLTVQRKSTIEEHVKLISAICEQILKIKSIPKYKVAAYFVKHHAAGFNKSYVYQLIPDEYKQDRPSKYAKALANVDDHAVLEPTNLAGTVVVPKSDASTKLLKFHTVYCTKCRTAIKLDNHFRVIE